MMDKRLWVTIDTEMDADAHWNKHWPPTYTSVLEGIPKLLRPIWNKYNVHPVYFVSPEVLYSEKCCEILKEEIENGAVIGAHLHPEYIEPEKIWGPIIEEVEPQFPNLACSQELEFAKIKNLTELIEEKLGVRPIWYRGARFGADLDTMYSLQKLGYQYDSSITPRLDWSGKGGPNHKCAMDHKYQIHPKDYYKEGDLGIYELPVTIMGKRWGKIGNLCPDNWLFYKWLRPTHMTYMELKKIIENSQKAGNSELVMMFHSMEIMVNKTPYVRAKWMQKYYLWRLKKTICYALTVGYKC